jgi:hypothetical protein
MFFFKIYLQLFLFLEFIQSTSKCGKSVSINHACYRDARKSKYCYDSEGILRMVWEIISNKRFSTGMCSL